MIERIYEQYIKTRTVVTDSRHITPGCIFFALKGDHFDGNAFAEQALRDGAALCVIDNPGYRVDDERCLLVESSLKVLQELARYHRQQMTIPVIGITGTNGKTTTKELVNAVLSKKYRTHATQGNYNNHLGVPLTILSTPADTEVLIVEMGANHPFEIDALCKIANPEFGLITNVGKAHLEGFGSFKGVVKTKCELYTHLAARAGVIFVDAANDILMERAEKMSVLPSSPTILQGMTPAIPTVTPTDYSGELVPRGVNMPMASVVTYGQGTGAEFPGTLSGADPYLKFSFADEEGAMLETSTQLIGGYNFVNAMAAVAVGRYFEVPAGDIRDAIAEYHPTNNRSQVKHTAHNCIIMDCYNANPSSMQVAVENFAALKPQHEYAAKVAILGSMRELGGDSEREHEKLLKQVKSCRFDKVILVGEEMAKASRKLGGVWFSDVEGAKKYLAEQPVEGATVLLKGSNGNKMWLLEEVL
ncbi:MAG: UDP-N-acetylmuramoyl-tripeptide--D-alanyl-D-alanine ligase [Bacteroidales bacterium]|nr:UDP-N-acetylmuramoyl-tripeptide--D-alanyl-D-alanine ligase [Bacteroidales bacterium]